jgi:hypothetical protein
MPGPERHGPKGRASGLDLEPPAGTNPVDPHNREVSSDAEDAIRGQKTNAPEEPHRRCAIPRSRFSRCLRVLTMLTLVCAFAAPLLRTAPAAATTPGRRQDRLLACRRCHLLDRSRRDRHPKARRASGFPRVVTEREVARLLTARRDQRGLEHEHLGREARRHGAPATDVRELALVSAGPNVDPAWSPDGTKIAFDTLTDDAWKSEI